MRIAPRNCVIGAAILAVLGAGAAEAAAASLHTMKVDAPDGAVVHVQYTGDVVPRVEFVPVDQVVSADRADPAMMLMADPFAGMGRISAIVDAQMNAMMQRVALMQQQAAQMQAQAAATPAVAGNAAPGFTMVGNVPQGMHVTYYSATTSADGCTRTVSYSSDGSGAAPKMVEAASDVCDAADANRSAMPAAIPAAIPAKAEVPAKVPEGPGQKV
ncbi:hypothetical protein [Novosphingobium sp. KN65.2]|uniref:hypothetical protein n=1 Tax=Novosphingobium sp. KN65.2 TaxID=1478134 RepID=UPI0005DEEFFD|nr:hypothetical protein [Novosphingobium sp. KN65.2]CDO37508.1 conserved exported hypothetical protein [Novosphingobium sp. KN65.2]